MHPDAAIAGINKGEILSLVRRKSFFFEVLSYRYTRGPYHPNRYFDDKEKCLLHTLVDEHPMDASGNLVMREKLSEHFAKNSYESTTLRYVMLPLILTESAGTIRAR